MHALSVPRRCQVAEQELVCDVSASPVASSTMPSMLFDSGDSAQEVRGQALQCAGCQQERFKQVVLVPAFLLYTATLINVTNVDPGRNRRDRGWPEASWYQPASILSALHATLMALLAVLRPAALIPCVLLLCAWCRLQIRMRSCSMMPRPHCPHMSACQAHTVHPAVIPSTDGQAYRASFWSTSQVGAFSNHCTCKLRARATPFTLNGVDLFATARCIVPQTSAS